MESERRHFDAIAPHYYDVVDAVWYDSGYYHRQELEVVTRCFKASAAPLELLDAGCGPGRHARALADLGHAVAAVDVSTEMLHRAGAMTHRAGDIAFVAADVRQLPFSSDSFDGVVCIEVLEHLPNHLEDADLALAEFARVLRGDGLLVVEAPLQPHEELVARHPDLRGSWKELQEMLDPAAGRQYAERPLGTWLHFDESSVTELLDRHGFTVLARRYVRVLPSGLVERFPVMEALDAVLEGHAHTQGLAREAVWVAQRTSGARTRGAVSRPSVERAERAVRGPEGDELQAALEATFASLAAHAGEVDALQRERQAQQEALSDARRHAEALRVRLEHAEADVIEVDERRQRAEAAAADAADRRRRAEHGRYEAERELTMLRSTAAMRLAGKVWTVLNTALPQGSRRRRAYQRLRSRGQQAAMEAAVSTPVAVQRRHDVVADLLDFESRIRSAKARTVAVLFCGTQLIESEGQRPTQFALALASQGIPVVFAYWRWGPEEWAAQDRLDESILQVPIDVVVERPGLLADAFVGLRRLALFEFPYPGFFELLANLNAVGWTTVYDVLDDWQEFHRVGQAEWYDAAFEAHLITGVDAVTAVNGVLADRVRGLGGEGVEVIGNGLRPSVATSAVTRPLERGELTLGYFGHLTGAWFDWRLVAEVARRAPTWKVYLIGYGGDPGGLELPPNVEVLGRKPQHELAAYAANWDVGIIPFKPERLAAGADPIKTYEYLAMGLPVVVTGVHPPPGGEEFVVRVDGADELVDAAQQAAALSDAHADRRREFAYTCTWDLRVRRLLDTASHRGQRVAQKDRLFSGGEHTG